MMSDKIARTETPAALTAGLYNDEHDVRCRGVDTDDRPPLTRPAVHAGAADDSGRPESSERASLPRDQAGEPVATRISELHLTEPGRRSLRVCSERVWFWWALEQFNLFDSAPRPGADFGHWVDKLRRWLATGAGDVRKRSAAQFILHAWNADIKVRGAAPIEMTFGGMDDRNRRAVVTILQNWRCF